MTTPPAVYGLFHHRCSTQDPSQDPPGILCLQRYTCPKTLLLYATSMRLRIVEFKVPNETPTYTAVDSISTTSQTPKSITFSTPLQTDVVKPSNKQQTPRSVIKLPTLLYHWSSVAPLQDHSYDAVVSFQDH